MQTSLVRMKEVVALNRFFFLESVWACCYDNQSGHSSIWHVFHCIIIVKFVVAFLS